MKESKYPSSGKKTHSDSPAWKGRWPLGRLLFSTKRGGLPLLYIDESDGRGKPPKAIVFVP